MFQIPFPFPPIACLYVAGHDQDKKNINLDSEKLNRNYLIGYNEDQKKIVRRKYYRDVSSYDKLFICTGKALIIIANGYVQEHYYPFKLFVNLVMTNGGNWYLPFSSYSPDSRSMHSKLSYSSFEQDNFSQSSYNSENSSMKSDLENIQLKIGTSMLFIISAYNSSMVLDLKSGTFFDFPGYDTIMKEHGEGSPEDFQYNSICMSSVISLPNYNQSPYHSIEDRFLLGVVNERTGALHNVGLGHKLYAIMQGKWYENLPYLFTTKSFSGSTRHSLLLIQYEKTIDNNKEENNDKNKSDIKKDNYKRLMQYPFTSPLLKEDDVTNLSYTYSYSLFTVQEDAVEYIDSKTVGIDVTKKTIALSSASGAIVYITSAEVRIIPTLKFSIRYYGYYQKYLYSVYKDYNNNNNNIKYDPYIYPMNQQDDTNQYIQSEYIGYDFKHKISWQAPYLLTEDFCKQQFINPTLYLSSSSLRPVNYHSPRSSLYMHEYPHYNYRITFENACITDKLIAVSYKCIVYVLVWNPAIPKNRRGSVDTLSYLGNQQMLKETPTANVNPVSTLCFPSNVKSLSASTIKTRSFLVVGCESPNAVFVFRLDNDQVGIKSEYTRKNLWDAGERLVEYLKNQIIYPVIYRPKPELVVQNGVKYRENEGNSQRKDESGYYYIENYCTVLDADTIGTISKYPIKYKISYKPIKYVEVSYGSHMYVEVYCSSMITMTRLFDLFPFDRPEYILLTTFKNQVRIFTKEELDADDMNHMIGATSLYQVPEYQYYYTYIEINQNIGQKNYLSNDGAALLIAGHNGQFITTIVPLYIILNFPPMYPKYGKLFSKAQFFFPSLIHTMKLFQQPAKMVEAEDTMYIYGDKTYSLQWGDRTCKIVWTDLECFGVIHSLMPMRVADDEPYIKNNNIDDSTSEVSYKSINHGSYDSLYGNLTNLTPAPRPDLVWIDHTEQKLSFGCVDKLNILTRQIQDLPSLPLAVVHVPTLHSIAVLSLEKKQYSYFEPIYIQDNDTMNFFDEGYKEFTKKYKESSGIAYFVNKTTAATAYYLVYDTYLPFQSSFVNYLKDKWNNKENIDNTQYNSEYSYNNYYYNIEISYSTYIYKINKYQLQYNGYYFHQSIPYRDYKGELFVDVATDWFNESHSKFFRNYSLKKDTYFKHDPPKVNLCYSTKTNFSVGHPHYISPSNIIGSIKKRNYYITKLKKYLISVYESEVYNYYDNKYYYYYYTYGNLSYQSISQYSTNNQIKKEEKNDLSSRPANQTTVKVIDSYMIMLYDESEMHLKVGELNLSSLKLDFGFNKSNQNYSNTNNYNFSSQSIYLYSESDYKTISTELYNFFNMVCITVPTFQGAKEFVYTQHRTINELEKVTKEFGYDDENYISYYFETMNKYIDKLDNVDIKYDISYIRELIKMYESIYNNSSKNETYSIKDNSYNEVGNINHNSYLRKNYDNTEIFNENDYLERYSNKKIKFREESQKYITDTALLETEYNVAFNDRFARSFLCVAGREGIVNYKITDYNYSDKYKDSNKIIQQIDELYYETFSSDITTDIFIFEIERHHILGNARNIALYMLDKEINNKDNDDNNINNKTNTNINNNNNNNEYIYFNNDQIENALLTSENIKHSFPDISSSVVTSDFDPMELLNVSVKLYKRIRILGGIYAIYGFLSTLVVINGRGAFVFILGSRLDDYKVNVVSNIYNIKSYYTEYKNKDYKNDKYFNYLNTHNNLEYYYYDYYFNVQQCSCNTPLFSEDGKSFPSAPFHASITNVRNLQDFENLAELNNNITLPNKRHFYVYSNDSSAVPSRPIESYSIHSPFTFNVKLIAFIIAPSPITNIHFYFSQHRPFRYSLPNYVQPLLINGRSNMGEFTANFKLGNVVPRYMMLPRYLRASVVFAPCGFAFVDIFLDYVNYIVSATYIKYHYLCAFNMKDAYLFDEVLRKSKEYSNIKKKIKSNQKIRKSIIINANSKLNPNQSKITDNYPATLSAFHKIDDYHYIKLPGVSIMPLSFAYRRCIHCNRVCRIADNIPNKNMHNQYYYLYSGVYVISYDVKVISDNSVNRTETQEYIKGYEIPTSKITHPMIGYDLAMIAGIYLKHRKRDLVYTAAVFGQYTKLVAYAYSSTLIIDASLLGLNQFGLVGDQEVLIYTLVPNPLYKKAKRKKKSKLINEKLSDYDKDIFECLPLCAVLNARIPTSYHFSFIKRCNAGFTSIFGGDQNDFFRKMYLNLIALQSYSYNANPQKYETPYQYEKPYDNIEQNQDKQIQIRYPYTEIIDDNDESTYAEDFENDYYLHMSDHLRDVDDLLEISPKGSMQYLPEIPPFIIMSRQGNIVRSIPSFYDKIPMNDLFVLIYVLQVQILNFGDIWKCSQIKVIDSHRDVEERTFKLAVIDQAVREFIATGKIYRRPPIKHADYLAPSYAIRDGRFQYSEILFGLSPFPITIEATNWKIMNFQNVIIGIEQLSFYLRTFNYHRLVIREAFRRFIKYFKSLNIPIGTYKDIQNPNHHVLMKKEVHFVNSSLTCIATMIKNKVTNFEAYRIQNVFKQARLGMNQIILALTYPNKKFIKNIYDEFQYSKKRQRDLDFYYWVKYRFVCIDDPVGVEEQTFNDFRDDLFIADGHIPEEISIKPVKMLNQPKVKLSEYYLDLVNITEKVLYNKVQCQTAGLNLKLENLFQSIVKVNKNVQMISNTADMCEKIHLNPNEEKLSSDEENSFLAKFNYPMLPMFLESPYKYDYYKKSYRNDTSPYYGRYNEKYDIALKEIQRRIPNQFENALQYYKDVPLIDSKIINSQNDVNKTQKESNYNNYGKEIDKNQLKTSEKEYQKEKERLHRHEHDSSNKHFKSNESKVKDFKPYKLAYISEKRKESENLAKDATSNKIYKEIRIIPHNYYLDHSLENEYYITPHPLSFSQQKQDSDYDDKDLKTEIKQTYMHYFEYTGIEYTKESDINKSKYKTDEQSHFTQNDYTENPIIQHAQVSHHFVRYNKRQQDIDWSEYTGTVLEKDANKQQKLNESEYYGVLNEHGEVVYNYNYSYIQYINRPNAYYQINNIEPEYMKTPNVSKMVVSKYSLYTYIGSSYSAPLLSSTKTFQLSDYTINTSIDNIAVPTNAIKSPTNTAYQNYNISLNKNSSGYIQFNKSEKYNTENDETE